MPTQCMTNAVSSTVVHLVSECSNVRTNIALYKLLALLTSQKTSKDGYGQSAGKTSQLECCLSTCTPTLTSLCGEIVERIQTQLGSIGGCTSREHKIEAGRCVCVCMCVCGQYKGTTYTLDHNTNPLLKLRIAFLSQIPHFCPTSGHRTSLRVCAVLPLTCPHIPLRLH